MTVATDGARHQSSMAPILLIVFCYTSIVVSMSGVGIFVSFIAQIAASLHISPARAGLALSVYSVPGALICVPIGRLIDRIGIKGGMSLAGVVGAAGSLLLANAANASYFFLGMALQGISFGCMAVACPSALVSWLDGDLRTRALSFWSTYGPVGYACGLLIAIPFAGAGEWRHAFIVNAAVFAAVAGLALLLPAKPATVQVRSFRAGMALFLRDPAVIRLAISLALPNAVAYGVSVVIPSYLEHVYGLSLKTSNGGIAGAKILAMMCGGVLTGYLLIRKVPFRVLYRTLIIIGIAALFGLFMPFGTFASALVGLVVWLIVFGGLAGSATAQLPELVASRDDIGLASGLIGQTTSFVCLLAPPVFLAIPHWSELWGLTVAVLLVAACAVPSIGRRRP
ncbi:MFS transporter [Gluconobacter wancherniae]|uniref:MFS transporter n=1 Tax=Gluconobacter wancherniae TaxID=1307955 RepID=UPI001B8B3E3E|nr:MFS transporter [Gluconobacter wancherniae]MBS1089720.1 MFS transporter [Gluconobacter wancherniae]